MWFEIWVVTIALAIGLVVTAKIIERQGDATPGILFESSRVVFIGRLSWRPLSFDPPALSLPCIGRCCFRLRHCRRRSGRRVIVRKRKQIVFPPLRELHIQSIHKYFPIRRV